MESQDAVDFGWNYHCDAAGDSALDAAGDREDIERQLRAMRLVDFDASDSLGRGNDDYRLVCNQNIFVRFVRQDSAEPANRGDDADDESESADRRACHK